MKKILFTLMTFTAGTIFGLPLGNPSDPSLYYHEPTCDGCGTYYEVVSLGVGFYGDYVFNRHLETIHNRDIEDTEITTNAAYFVLSLFEHIDIFATVGGTNLFLHTNFVAFNALDPEPRFDIDSTTAFSWSIGERITLWTCGPASLGIEGQYFETHPKLKRLYIAAGGVAYPGDDLPTKYKEWQVGLGFSYRYQDIIPYIGVKWSHAEWLLGNKPYRFADNANTTFFDLRNQKSWGFALGATISRLCCDKIAVTVEGRFGDEKAAYVNGQMRF